MENKYLLELKISTVSKCLTSLKEALSEPYSTVIRDATLLRFRNSVDTFWKFLKEYLKTSRGITVNSPKDSFREIFSQGFTSEEETKELLDMTDSRNETAHTYKEDLAQEIYEKIKGYASLMNKVLMKIVDKK